MSLPRPTGPMVPPVRPTPVKQPTGPRLPQMPRKRIALHHALAEGAAGLGVFWCMANLIPVMAGRGYAAMSEPELHGLLGRMEAAESLVPEKLPL